MTKGKLYEYIKSKAYSPGYKDPRVIETCYIDEFLNEAKKEFEQIKSLLKEPDMPNMSREFQVLLCWNEWKIKYFGDEE